MLHMFIKNDHGVTLIELLVTMILVSIGIFAALDVFPSSWRLTTQSDRIGQASEIMHRELETSQLIILNSCNTAIMGGTTTLPVNASGRTGTLQGDVSYTVSRTITALGTGSWGITVQVTWPGNAVGVSGTIVSVRDANYKEGCL